MSMFFLVEASGPETKDRKQLLKGFTSISRPEHMTSADIMEHALEHNDTFNTRLVLDRSVCDNVQLLEDPYSAYGCKHYILLVKAKGVQQAEDLVKAFGKTQTRDFPESQRRAREYKERVERFENEAKELLGPKTNFKFKKRWNGERNK